jgi:hypothetical protein
MTTVTRLERKSFMNKRKCDRRLHSSQDGTPFNKLNKPCQSLHYEHTIATLNWIKSSNFSWVSFSRWTDTNEKRKTQTETSERETYWTQFSPHLLHDDVTEESCLSVNRMNNGRFSV